MSSTTLKQSVYGKHKIFFDDSNHTYFDSHKNRYSSVTQLLSSFQEKFDAPKIAAIIAKKEGRTTEDVLKEWEDKKDSSVDWGNLIHNNLENFWKLQPYDAQFEKLAREISDMVAYAKEVLPEVLIYYADKKIAGQSDLVVNRNANVYDFYDYKTNESKGIVFDSMAVKNGEIKYYNRYFKYPMAHLEDCNYVKYALQLSIYAYMAEMEFGWKIGRLAILFIDKKLNLNPIPVPYMRFEAELLLEYFSVPKAPIRMSEQDVLNSF